MLRGSAAGGLGQGIFFHWVALHIEELTVVVKLVLLGPHPAFAVFAFGKRELTEILLRPAKQGRDETFSVQLAAGELCLGQFGEGGQPIAEIYKCLALASSRDGVLPVGNQGHVGADVEQRPLAAGDALVVLDRVDLLFLIL